MSPTVVSLRLSWLTRILLTLLLILALAGGTGVVMADSDENSGQNCPEENPTNAYNNTSDTAVKKSTDGRQEAVEGGECTTE